MITGISKEFTFEAAHRLPNVPVDHKCHRLHGHSFRIVIRVTGEVDPTMGWIVDFADIERAWRPLHEKLDHRYLNEVPGLENPTSELLAKWILEHTDIKGARVRSVTVQETCTAQCTITDTDR